jgi:hypothetical protein
MTCRVDRERSILGTELEEPKIGRSKRGRDGTGECVENVTHGAMEAQGNLARLAPGGLKKGKAARRAGLGAVEGTPKTAPNVAALT